MSLSNTHAYKQAAAVLYACRSDLQAASTAQERPALTSPAPAAPVTATQPAAVAVTVAAAAVVWQRVMPWQHVWQDV